MNHLTFFGNFLFFFFNSASYLYTSINIHTYMHIIDQTKRNTRSNVKTEINLFLQTYMYVHVQYAQNMTTITIKIMAASVKHIHARMLNSTKERKVYHMCMSISTRLSYISKCTCRGGVFF